MARIRNLKLNDVTVEQPYYTDSEGTRHQLTKWIHNGVVVWENGGSYKGIYYISNNSSYAYSYLRYYDFDTGEDTRLLSLRNAQNSYSYNLYVDNDGLFFIASQAYSGNYGYSYYGYKDITQRTRLNVGIGTTSMLPFPMLSQHGIYVNDASTTGTEVLISNDVQVEYKTNIPEGEWDFANCNVISYGTSTSAGGSYLIQYDKENNTYYRRGIYDLLNRSIEQYTWMYSDSRSVTFNDSVFVVAWLRYFNTSSGPYYYEEHLFVYNERGIISHSGRFTDINNTYSNVSLIATSDKVYRVGNYDDGNYAVLKTTDGINYENVGLPDYLDIYTKDRTKYVRIVFNGSDTYPATEGTKVGSALAKNLTSQHRNHALKNMDDEIEQFNGLLFVVNGYYAYIDNYEMQNSDGNIAFQRQY